MSEYNGYKYKYHKKTDSEVCIWEIWARSQEQADREIKEAFEKNGYIAV